MMNSGWDIWDTWDIGTYNSAFQRCGHRECDFRLGQLGHLRQGSTADDTFYGG